MEFHPVLLSLMIFFARICDVSLGTIRTIIVFRGYRFIAAIIGFFEVTIWILAVGKVLANVNAWYLVVAYAAGYGMGNMVGIWLEGKLAIGSAMVRIFSKKMQNTIASALRENDFFVIEVPANGGDDNQPIDIIFAVTKRRDLPFLLKIIKDNDPESLYTVEDVRSLHHKLFPNRKKTIKSHWWNTAMKRR